MATNVGDSASSTTTGTSLGQRLNSFFKDQALYGRFRIPTLIALLAGIAWAFQPVATFYALDQDVRIDIMNAAAAEWIVHFMMPFGIWLFVWAAFFALAKLLGGRIRVGRLFKLAGWGLAPIAAFGIVRAVGNYYAFQGETLPHEVRRGVMSAELEGYENMVAEVGADPAIVAATAAGCLLLVPSALLWMYAVRHSTDLEHRQVLTVVVVPTLALAAYFVGNLFL
ncbi:Yip1 family protein [Saliphagus infecundisoli]|uniref:Yip1 family protein n=1 Tax=Saliphagus infecundisoli TaxID=1849069 RepID=A0ABD5QHY1_9EURY|nr:Yip1 family protein [Saliphagus infecundisoli]